MKDTAILWGWREIGKNFPEYKDMKSFSVFPDVVKEKVKDLNNSSAGEKYECIKIFFEKV